jgi:hypothetical protein
MHKKGLPLTLKTLSFLVLGPLNFMMLAPALHTAGF